MKALQLLFCLATIGLSISATTATLSPQSVRRAVTADQVNGVYRNGENEFRILALGHQKLKVQFNGQWMTRWRYPNIGEALGEATIEGNVATFIPGNAPKCKITLTFLSNRVEVTQEGTDADCGFGHNVMATGTYRRIKGGKPRFIPVRQVVCRCPQGSLEFLYMCLTAQTNAFSLWLIQPAVLEPQS